MDEILDPRGRDARSVRARMEEDFPIMSRRCELTAKAPQVGHKVSHSNIKTKRRFLANLVNVTMISDALGRSVKLRISTNALKTVDRRGGLDGFLMKANDDELSVRARITGNYERRGHRFVDVNVLVLANRQRPVARIAHAAIWLPRQLAAA